MIGYLTVMGNRKSALFVAVEVHFQGSDSITAHLLRL